MVDDTNSPLALSDEAKSVVWRIFGSGASPLGNKSSFDLIEPIICEYVSGTECTTAISELRNCFDPHADNRWLRNDRRDEIAQLILDGVETELSERAVWAIGSIDCDLSASLIRSQWSERRIDAVATVAMDALCKARDQEKILDVARAARISGLDPRGATIPEDAIEHESKLPTLVHLDTHGWELVHHALHPAVANLLELVINLREQRFPLLLCQLGHVILQARAAAYIFPFAVKADHRAALRWLSGEVCDALVAVTIKHTLDTVNVLDDEVGASNGLPSDKYHWRTELRPDRDNFDRAAQSLLEDLVETLARFPQEVAGRWLGELLVNAPDILHGRSDAQKPRRIVQLESACTLHLSRLLGESPTCVLVPFRSALSLGRRKSWIRHMVDLAWYTRGVFEDRSQEIAQSALKQQIALVDQALTEDHFSNRWESWHDRENVLAMGRAVALSSSCLEVSAWAAEQCTRLPLTAWDVEERISSFLVAERIAQYWFLVGCHALLASAEIGRSIDPSDVRRFAESVWAHFDFIGTRQYHGSNSDIAAEAASRAAVRFGEATDAWILGQASNAAVGPRSLYALVHERAGQQELAGDEGSLAEKVFVEEFIRAAAHQFGDGNQFDLHALKYWGELWLVLNAPDLAKETAIAILDMPARPPPKDRATDILTLKLLAFAASHHLLSPTLWDCLEAQYSALWCHNTPDEERVDRKFVDTCLGR